MVSKSLDQIARVLCTFSSSKVAEGGDAGFQVTDENFPLWRGNLKKICEGPAKDRQNEFALRHTRDFRTKTGAGEALCAVVENKYRKLCGTYKFGPQPPSFKGK